MGDKYTVITEFVKQTCTLSHFLNDLPSTSRIELPKFSYFSSRWNAPIWSTCYRPTKSPHSERHWNLKSPSTSRIELPNSPTSVVGETPPFGQPATDPLNPPIATDTGIWSLLITDVHSVDTFSCRATLCARYLFHSTIFVVLSP